MKEDEKISDDVEKMIQQYLNVRGEYVEFYFIVLVLDFPCLNAEHDQVLEGMAQELLQLLRAHRARNRDPKQGGQGYED